LWWWVTTGAASTPKCSASPSGKPCVDDAYLISKPWLFKYRVYLIHQQLDDDTTLYYRELSEMLDQQGIPFVPGKYHD
jgi:hypothetical protein